MEWMGDESRAERLKAELLCIPSWAKAEQLERIVPQKDLWAPENLVRPDMTKEKNMEEKNKRNRKALVASLAALLLFAAATFQIADGNMLLGVVLFGAASCFSSLAGIYRERKA